MHSRQGWTLTSEHDDHWSTAAIFPRPPRYQLDGLRLTMAEARQLADRYASQGGAGPWGAWGGSVQWRTDLVGQDSIRADGIMLDEAQARAIARGADPFTVLLAPGRLAVRALTREELMA
jgi:hypothetical protein